MFKRFTYAVVFCLAALSVSAQSDDYLHSLNEADLTDPMATGWFIGGQVGGNAFIGNPRLPSGIGDKVHPNVGLYLGKWFSPRVGMRGAFSGVQFKNCCGRKNNYQNIHVDFMASLMPANSRFIVAPFIGGGWMNNSTEKISRFSLNYGLIGRYSLSQKVGLTLELANATTKEDFDYKWGKHAFGKDNMPTLMVGLSVRLGEQYTYYDEVVRLAPDDKVSRALRTRRIPRTKEVLVDTIYIKEVRIVETETPKEIAPVQPPVVNVGSNVPSPVIFYFKINSTSLEDPTVLKRLDAIAEWSIAKGWPVRVEGSADSFTGNHQTNTGLAGERAEYVIRQLENRGVLFDNIIKVNRAGNAYYPTPEANRNVRVELVNTGRR